MRNNQTKLQQNEEKTIYRPRKANKGTLCKDFMKWSQCNHEVIFEQGPCKYAHSISEVHVYNWEEYQRILREGGNSVPYIPRAPMNPYEN